jgi:tRNA(fMet)-specific endonuclease VapC
VRLQLSPAEIYGELEKSGQTIGRADPFIAGIAIAHNLQLVSGNTKHFERIAVLGFPLSLADWRM